MTASTRNLFALLCMLILAACSPPANRADQRAFEPIVAAQTLIDRIEALEIDGLPDDAQMQALAPLLAPGLRESFETARAWQRGLDLLDQAVALATDADTADVQAIRALALRQAGRALECSRAVRALGSHPVAQALATQAAPIHSPAELT